MTCPLMERHIGDDAIELLQDFLERRLQVHDRHRLARYAASAMRRQRGAVPIHELALHLGVSRRHLSRDFSEVVGMSPKRFAALEVLTRRDGEF